MDKILGDCDLARLRRRRTYKWRTYPADVLPAFAAARLGWRPDPALVFAIPDVMTGITEALLALPGARHVPFLSLDHPVAQRAIAFTSASKGWNIPGLKCGVAVAGSAAAAAVLSERRDALLASEPGLLATAAAFTAGGPWLDAMLAQVTANRDALAGLLREHLPAVGYVPPQASFLAWLDCRRLGLGDDPAAAFLEKGRVALSPGPDFGAAGRGYARLNIGTSPDLVTEAVRRMARAG